MKGPEFYYKKLNVHWPLPYNEVLWPEKGVGCFIIPTPDIRAKQAYDKYHTFFNYDKYGVEYGELREVFGKTMLNYLLTERKKYDTLRNVVIMGHDALDGHNILFFKRWLEHLRERRYYFRICLYTSYKPEDIPEYIWKYVTYVCHTHANYNERQVPIKNDCFIQFACRKDVLYDKNKRMISDYGRYYFDGRPKIEEGI